VPNLPPFVAEIEAGVAVDHVRLAELRDADRAATVAELLKAPAGRRWLRMAPELDRELANRLLNDGDFRQPRRDRSLVRVVERAALPALEHHIDTIAASPASGALWQRLADDPARLRSLAARLVAEGDAGAAEATLHLLVLDQLEPYRLGVSGRHQIASSALDSGVPVVRGLAAEFLAASDPAMLARDLDRLLADESQRVRAIAWDAALRLDRPAAVARASTLLSDETASTDVRRSALVALGALLPTNEMAPLLAYFVVHPDHELASDAAELLYERHRNPLAATAARESPHAEVREIAEQLLDPMRGSPAAGGSRPGDPTGSSAGIYSDMIRQLEEKLENHSDTSER
jgi:hypothetical protein